jgi:lysophospholipase L1-like esterase
MKSSLSRLADYAHANRINLYLAMMPDVHNLEHYQLGFAHQVLQETATSLGYTYLDLLPYFGKLPPKDIWAMPGDPHPNALGHQIMADAIYPVLTSRGSQ